MSDISNSLLLEEIVRMLLDKDSSQLVNVLSIEQTDEGTYVSVLRRNGKAIGTYKRVESMRATKIDEREKKTLARAVKKGIRHSAYRIDAAQVPEIADAVRMLSCRGSRVIRAEYFTSLEYPPVINVTRIKGRKSDSTFYKLEKGITYVCERRGYNRK
jgi:hypothetical protein